MSTEPTITGAAEVRLYGDLQWFADVDRDGRVTVPVGGRRSAKDVIESVGVPHVEVGALVVDGEPCDLDVQVGAGARLAVYPFWSELPTPVALRPAPPDPRRFVADVHLGTLARLLRLLGFDTWYATDADDHELAARSADEERILLTRDRQLLMRRVIVHGYCPRSSDPDEQLREVAARYGLADRAAPFTRCADCNGVLAPVAKDEVVDELPPATRREHDTFSRCPGCGKVYWPGTHVGALEGRWEQLLADLPRHDADDAAHGGAAPT